MENPTLNVLEDNFIEEGDLSESPHILTQNVKEYILTGTFEIFIALLLSLSSHWKELTSIGDLGRNHLLDVTLKKYHFIF